MSFQSVNLHVIVFEFSFGKRLRKIYVEKTKFSNALPNMDVNGKKHVECYVTIAAPRL